MKAKLVLFLSGFLAVAGILVMFNRMVDPQEIYHTISISDSDRTILEYHHRYKPAALLRYKPEFLVIGNSRILYGIPGDHPIFSGHRTFNAAATGLPLTEMAPLITALVDSGSIPERIFLFVDQQTSYIDRLRRPFRPYSLKIGFSLDPRKYYPPDYLFSMTTLKDSINKLFSRHRSGDHACMYRNGFVDYSTNLYPISHLAKYGLRKASEKEFEKHFKGHWVPVKTANLNAAVNSFRSILSAALVHHIRVDVITTPKHQLFTLLAASDFVWRDALVSEVRRVVAHGADVRWWDFGALTSITTSSLSSTSGEADLYYDPSHFTPKVGAEILSVVQAGKTWSESPIGGLLPLAEYQQWKAAYQKRQRDLWKAVLHKAMPDDVDPDIVAAAHDFETTFPNIVPRLYGALYP